ncbi:hypothetical protein CKO31_17570 [Thiohalocapsa halophila]|uniref:DUF4407 domain-containing protein n=1 Tax=Thiohalocapsa halophila TaxID=69359 RepID=A0ABS1CLF1_9GAMM|nr:DUF4407 domain-containing protein [Thiohalocapsa halophila]MBK1632518.1 hypothetical protein [Thiohalocapsa halophila]
MGPNAQGRRLLASLRDALPRLGSGRSARRDTDTSVAEDTGFPRRPSLFDIFTLRPYGRSLLTPAAGVWLGSAWVVILLMASIEGFVWGAVGASLVPSAAPWLRLPVAVFMFALLFAVVWIVDASLIMSERPSFARRRRHAMDERGGIGPVVRWYVGIAVRIAIVAISLYVTAPFIEKLIRADDIAAWHQAQVERYYEQRDATLREQVRARAEQRDQGLLGRVQALEADIARLEASLAAERERRERIEAEFAPQIEVLTRDLAAARERVGDEVLGREGRPEGYGPEARKWDERATLLEEQLAEIQAQREERLAGVEASIAELTQRLGERTDALQSVRREQAALLERITAEVEAEQPPAVPPKLTFAAQSKALADLKSGPAEAGVPHFETVEGFAQAALGILFFALLALKLFEPPAVHAYYSEDVQLHYRKYLGGGLDHIPGFDQYADPVRRLSPTDFARLWERWERDPEGYATRFQSVHAARARLQRLLADSHYESELLERRRDDIDARLRLERRRQEAELAAREQELAMQARESQRRLSAQTDAELEQLEHKRAEARKAHATALAEMERRAETERKRLDEELAQKRAAWEQERAAAQAELDLRRREFELEEQRARDQSKRKQMALDDHRRLKERELAQRADAERAEREAAAREVRARETRSLLEQEREAEARLRGELANLRTRRSERADRAAALDAEVEELGLREQELKAREGALRVLVDARGEPQSGGGLPFAGDTPARRRRRATRELKQLERELAALHRRQEIAKAERDGAKAAADDLSGGIAAMEQELAGVSARVEQYRGTLDTLLLSRGS